MPAKQALGARGDMGIADLCPQFRKRGYRPDRCKKMAFADAAIAREGTCHSVASLHARDLVDPLTHQLGCGVGEMVGCQRTFRVIRKVAQDLIRPDFYDIFYFFLNSFHAFGLRRGNGFELDKEEARQKATPVNILAISAEKKKIYN
jgi:hypothetical protein